MKTKLDRIAKDTNIFLKKFLNKQNNSKLLPVMKYGLFPGGKKIRSKVLIDFGSLLSIEYIQQKLQSQLMFCIQLIIMNQSQLKL